MSNGPTLTGDTCIEVTKTGYVNLNYETEDWCTYKGECKRYKLIFDRDSICLYCEYRKPLNIPEMIDRRIKENENSRNKRST